MDRLHRVLDDIDRANEADPDRSEGAPAARLYGERMSEELTRQVAAPSECLRIAARGQHIERWVIPRGDYPQGRQGYLAWRRDLAVHHARRLGEIMARAGYDEAETARVGQMVRKQGIKRDGEVQALEDVIAAVFLRWYLPGFAARHPEEKVTDILAKTARKMSADARARALAEHPDLPDAWRAALEG